MIIDWAPNTARANRANHGVSFSAAEAVLYDPNGITRENDRAEGEQRFVTVGLDALAVRWWWYTRIVATPSADHVGQKSHPQ